MQKRGGENTCSAPALGQVVKMRSQAAAPKIECLNCLSWALVIPFLAYGEPLTAYQHAHPDVVYPVCRRSAQVTIKIR